ncbi:MAG: nitrilase-related carbon-nitrogen hydrolase [Myxococcaceae bacterium]
MKVALCQFNPVIGAIALNSRRILTFAEQAHAQKADLIIFPELALCGYPLKDLVFLSDFTNACEAGLIEIAQKSPIPVLIGAPSFERYNAAYLCVDQKLECVAKKRLLPNYQVFDEERYFIPGDNLNKNYFDFKNKRLGVSICEDAWSEIVGYAENPIQDLVQKHQIDFLINMTASPFELDKSEEREQMFCELARRYQKPFLIAGQVGANDGVIFDGGSLAIDSNGQILWRAKSFEEDLWVLDAD